MHKALLFNRRLWTIFLSAVESNDNKQPLEVRQNIHNIGVFVMQRTIDIQLSPDPDETEGADRHQLPYRGGSRGQGLKSLTEALAPASDFTPSRRLRAGLSTESLVRSSEWK